MLIDISMNSRINLNNRTKEIFRQSISFLFLASLIVLSGLVKAQGAIPGRMANAPVAVVAGNNFTLSWQSVQNATYYKIQYRNGNGGWITSNSKYYNVSYNDPNAPLITNRSYRMRGCNNNGCATSWSPASNAVSTNPLPQTMLNAPAASVSGRHFTLTWQAVDHASYYKIQYRDGSSAWNTSGSKYYGTSFNDPNAPTITNRSYRMRGCNERGCASYWSSASNAVTIKPIPATMVEAPIASISGSNFSLDWRPVQHANYYIIQYRDGNNSWESSDINYYGVSFNDPNAPIIIERSYRMKGCNDSGCGNSWSSASNSITFNPTVPIMGSAPVVDVQGSYYSLVWNAVEHASFYNIQYRDGNGEWNTSSLKYYGTSFNDPDAPPMIDRSYRMRGCHATNCALDWSPASNPVSIYAVPKKMLVAPEASVEGSNFNLVWDTVNFATYYNVQYRDGLGDWKTSSRNYVGSSSNDTGVEPMTDRSYRMRGCNDEGCASEWSPPSNSVTISPLPLKIESAPVANVLETEFTLTWIAIANASYYEIQYRDGAEDWNTSTVKYQGTSLNDPSASPMFERSYRIRGCNATGCAVDWSDVSNQVSILKIPEKMNIAPEASTKGNNFTISWEKVDFSTHYNLQYREGAGGWVTSTRNYEGNSFTDLDALPITDRSYRMRGCNLLGCAAEWSDASNSVTIQYTLPSRMTRAPLASVEDREFKLVWEEVDYATYYKIQFRDGDSDWKTSSINYNGTVFSEPDFTPISNRTYRMRGCNFLGCAREWSDVSNAVSFKSDIDVVFERSKIKSYGNGQDLAGTVEVLDGGKKLRLVGNLWKQIPLNYTVTPNTVLEFDFSSSQKGEIHAIGLSKEDFVNSTEPTSVVMQTAFQLFGRRVCTTCSLHYKDYKTSELTKSYRIPIGKFYTGEYSNLFFVMDEDEVERTTAESIFSDVRIVESDSVPGIITFDDKHPDAVATGYWWVGTPNESAWKNQYRVASSNSVRFTHYINALPESGTYEVAVWHTGGGEKRKANVQVQVKDDNGTTNYSINQQINKSTWNRLGIHTFTKNNNGFVKTFGQEGQSAVSADAVRLIRVDDADTAPVSLSYPGSEVDADTTSLDSFMVSATPTSGQESDVTKVEFSLDGIDWFEASVVDNVYTYDFDMLLPGDYTLSVRVTTTSNGEQISTTEFTVTNAGVKLRYKYDALGRVVCVIDPYNGNRDYDYDDAGNREQVTTVAVCTE